MIEILKWKSFTLVTKVDDENNDDVQSITKKLMVNAIANNLCVIIHDNDKEGMIKKLCFIFYIKYLSFSTIFFNNVYIYHKKVFIIKFIINFRFF